MNKQEAIKWLEEMLPTFKEGSQEWEVTTIAIEALEEPQKGEWIYGNGNGECSVCGKEKSMGWDNYCGYCGAYMKGEGVSNEKIGLESILNEIKETLAFYSFDVPMVYGDGEETVEKAVLLEEVEYAIQSISDMRGGTENE